MDHTQEKISRWAETTFSHTEQGIALHLLREAVELAVACGLGWVDIRESVEGEMSKLLDSNKQPKIDEETADVTILAFAMAGHVGFSLSNAIIAKHAVNVVRKWGEPDKQGVTEHLDEA